MDTIPVTLSCMLIYSSDEQMLQVFTVKVGVEMPAYTVFKYKL